MLYGAFNFGQAAPNLEDLLTAAGASGAILDTIDRVGYISLHVFGTKNYILHD